LRRPPRLARLHAQVQIDNGVERVASDDQPVVLGAGTSRRKENPRIASNARPTASSVRQSRPIEATILTSNQASYVERFNQRSATGAKAVNARARSKSKVDASEVRAKYAALETEIRLLRELRSQVSSKLKKQVQTQARWSRRVKAMF